MKNSLIFTVLIVVATIFSCKEKIDPPMLEVAGEECLFEAVGGQKNIDVTANVDWKASSSGAWLKTAKSGAKLSLIADANNGLDARETTVTVSADNVQSVSIKVQQIGSAPNIIFDNNVYTMSATGGNIFVILVSNIAYEVLVPEGISWITHEGKTQDKEKFVITESFSEHERSAEIEFKQIGGEYVKKLTITQESSGTEYKPGNASGFANDTKVPVTSALASESHSSGDVSKSFDGNMSTLYHSRWGEDTQYPVVLQYFFTNAEQIDYLVYHPRSDGGSNGNFKEFKLYAKTGNNTEYTYYGTYDFQGSGSASKVIFKPALINPKEVKFEVLSGRGDNIKGFVSCAEMEFYRAAESNDFSAVFTDQTCSELRPGVTEEQIESINNSFVRKMAIYMFRNQYNFKYRLNEYKPYPSPDNFAKINKISPYSLLDNPTGISVTDNEDAVIFVGPTGGMPIALRVLDFSQEEYNKATKSYPLSEGLNKLKITTKGLLYIYYITDSPSAQPVKIHIASGKVNGYFDLAKNSPSEWSQILANTVHPYLDLVGFKTHLVFPVSSYNQYVSDGAELVKTTDRIAELEQEFLGFYKYNRIPKNRLFMHVDYGTLHMYATHYHTGYNIKNAVAEVLNVNTLKTSTIWGPAHELGHVHQTRPGFKWLGLTEVSNNVYSLYVQTSFGNSSRLLSDQSKDYLRAFNEIIVADIPHAQLTETPYFPKLVPFWQLYLFSKAIDRSDFYKDLHEQVRINPDRPTSANGLIQLDFVKYCCDLLETDLTLFFEQWGLLQTVDLTINDYGDGRITITATDVQDIKNYVAGRPYAANKAPGGLCYLTDNNFNIFQNQQSIGIGTATRSGQNVTCTGWSNVMAYETLYDGKLVNVSLSGAFSIPSNYSGSLCTVKAVAWDGARIDVTF